jgi:hypothetical protein
VARNTFWGESCSTIKPVVNGINQDLIPYLPCPWCKTLIRQVHMFVKSTCFWLLYTTILFVSNFSWTPTKLERLIVMKMVGFVTRWCPLVKKVHKSSWTHSAADSPEKVSRNKNDKKTAPQRWFGSLRRPFSWKFSVARCDLDHLRGWAPFWGHIKCGKPGAGMMHSIHGTKMGSEWKWKY